MSLFVPEYIAFGVVLLVFIYHVVKELIATHTSDEERMNNHQRTRSLRR